MQTDYIQKRRGEPLYIICTKIDIKFLPLYGPGTNLLTRSFSRHSLLIIKSFYCKIFLRVSCATTGWFWDTSRKNRALQTLKWQPNAISLFIDSMPGTLLGYLTDQVSSKEFPIRTCYYNIANKNTNAMLIRIICLFSSHKICARRGPSTLCIIFNPSIFRIQLFCNWKMVW